MTPTLVHYGELTLIRAPYAVQPEPSRGRLYPVSDDFTRTPTARDRDRIIHSGSFRKLKGKTQVFLPGQGDYFRTRLTHSIEVAQIARTMARVLKLDEDLAESCGLAHDIGHTCFGHTGEYALQECMKNAGSFDHNEQALRALMIIERPYSDHAGLNLCWETVEGLLKHNGPLPATKRGPSIKHFDALMHLQLDSYASLEAQLAAVADDIAYNAHDVDDAHRAGVLSYEQIRSLPFYDEVLAELEPRLWHETERARIAHAMRKVISMWMDDVMTFTRANIAKVAPQTADDVRRAGFAMADFSEPTWAKLRQLKKRMLDEVYRHPSTDALRRRATELVTDLYTAFINDPALIPPDYRHREEFVPRAAADYIAGMTDRFAIATHAQLTGKPPMVYGV